jgi:hypothetical protein
MNALTLQLENEIASLDERSAIQFRQAMLTMLKLLKKQVVVESELPFSERIAQHRAIGSWPADLDGDQHIAALRNEWDH